MAELITYEQLIVTDELVKRSMANGTVCMGIVHYQGKERIKAVKKNGQWGRLEYSSFLPFTHAIATYFKGTESIVKFYTS